ncbi:hypothetical protein F4679DRAFT_596816 [Xylaria curta]|nr:hypothetical protein F4679DRAFT_596816 [Xylaria curta]
MAHQRPSSPWAQRFGHGQDERNPFINDAVHHSGFAPKLPPLHPKYYADKPPQDDSARTASELDYVFASETFQFRHLRGCYSWMVGPLMRYVCFSERTGLISGGHRAADKDPVDPKDAAAVMKLINPPAPDSTDSANPVNPAENVVTETQEDLALKIFHSERIQVDESKWFDFLKKDRWLDWEEPQILFNGSNWSVDNPQVWEVLSISIELLDRVIKALVADKHVVLETVLYGVDIPWESLNKSPPPFKNAHFLFSLEYMRDLSNAWKVPCRYDFIDQFTPGEYSSRLEHLLSDQTWSFVQNYQNDDSTWGVTLLTLGNLIAIDVGDIRKLITGDITIAERCLIQCNLMATMLHELFHSLFQCRRVDQTWPANLPPINCVKNIGFTEPFLGGDSAAEMGYAAEQRVFGGQMVLGPKLCDDLPLGAYTMDWPGPQQGAPGEDIDEDGAAFQAGRIVHITRVPALFSSKMLSAEFWNDATIPRKSDDYFHRNRLFTSDTKSHGRDYPLNYAEARLHNFGKTSGERQMITAWMDRKRDWDQRRAGWFEQTLREWRRTPWSDIRNRQMILKFSRAFAYKNHIECRYIARKIHSWVNYSEDQDMYIQDLPPHKQNDNWVFHAVGLLMLAALPIQNDKIRLDTKYFRTWRFLPREGTTERLKIIRENHRTEPWDDRVIPPSVLYDPLGRPGEIKDAKYFCQEDYLDVLGRLIDYFARNDVAVSHPWLRQILDTAEDLRRQRRDDGPDGARSKTSWVKYWRFLIPEYNTSVARFQYGRWTVQA